MCSVCLQTPCHPRCPNYSPPKSTCYCSICNEGILDGEEYVENDIGEYAHLECVDYGRELVRWLGHDIRIMENDYEK